MDRRPTERRGGVGASKKITQRENIIPEGEKHRTLPPYIIAAPTAIQSRGEDLVILFLGKTSNRQHIGKYK